MPSIFEARLARFGISSEAAAAFQKAVPGEALLGRSSLRGGFRGGFGRPSDPDAASGGQQAVNPLLKLFAAQFQARPAAAPEQSRAIAPGDPGNIRAAQERQAASEAALNIGASDPIVAGRSEALEARRRARGAPVAAQTGQVSPLGRGFTARNLLSTSSI